MPSPIAACIIRMASLSSLSEPMCQPPRQTIDTRCPVLPRTRVGKPALDALVWARTCSARAATDAATVAFATNSLREVLSAMEITLSFWQAVQPPADLFQALQNFLLKTLLGGRRFPLQEKSAARLQNAALNFAEVR